MASTIKTRLAAISCALVAASGFVSPPSGLALTTTTSHDGSRRQQLQSCQQQQHRLMATTRRPFSSQQRGKPLRMVRTCLVCEERLESIGILRFENDAERDRQTEHSTCSIILIVQQALKYLVDHVRLQCTLARCGRILVRGRRLTDCVESLFFQGRLLVLFLPTLPCYRTFPCLQSVQRVYWYSCSAFLELLLY